MCIQVSISCMDLIVLYIGIISMYRVLRYMISTWESIMNVATLEVVTSDLSYVSLCKSKLIIGNII